MPDNLNLNVLVVDDALTVRAYLQAFLSERGCRVESAENGKAATEVLRRFKPDLIILDFHMPEMDGFTMLRTLQSEPDWSGIAIFVLTGKSLDGGTSQMISQEPNVKSVLAKPTDERTLSKKLLEFSRSLGKLVEAPQDPSQADGLSAAPGADQIGTGLQTFSLDELEQRAKKKPDPKPPEQKP